jgi:hypothetical protein
MMRRPHGHRPTLATGRKTGARTEKFKPSKDEMYRVICACKALGFGNDFIGHWTGFSASMVALYCQDFKIGSVDVSRRPAQMFDLLPAELQRELNVIKTKSAIAHARAKNRLEGNRAIATHELVDDEDEPLDNRAVEVRPEKAAA